MTVGRRGYAYDVLILWNAKNLTDATEVEASNEAMPSKFENNPTLSGTPIGLLRVSMAP